MKLAPALNGADSPSEPPTLFALDQVVLEPREALLGVTRENPIECLAEVIVARPADDVVQD